MLISKLKCYYVVMPIMIIIILDRFVWFYFGSGCCPGITNSTR